MSKNFKQYDTAWRSYPYCKTTMKAAGCGPTAIADIYYNFDKYITPPKVADWLASNGYDSNKQGTVWTGIPAFFKAKGCDAKQLNLNSYYGRYSSQAEDEWKKAMQSGEYWGILLMGKGYWTSGGHYIAVTEYSEKKDKYYVMDPASAIRTGWHPWKKFDGEVKIFYLIKNPNAVKKKTSEKLVVDGQWGKATTSAAQAKFGVKVDGIVSRQPKYNQALLPFCEESSWEFFSSEKDYHGGSDLVKAMQRKFAIKADGYFGVSTIEALQSFLGLHQSGVCSKETVKAFQRYLNS